MVTRRQFLLGGTALGGLIIAGGGTFLITDRYEGWISKILHRYLPGYRLDPHGLARFIDDYNKKQGDALKLRMFAAVQGVVDAKALLPGGTKTEVDNEARRILSAFLVGSDFFDNYPNGPKTITYSGVPVACSSPFATF